MIRAVHNASGLRKFIRDQCVQSLTNCTVLYILWEQPIMPTAFEYAFGCMANEIVVHTSMPSLASFGWTLWLVFRKFS